jgi:hypothetical protein
MEGSWEVKDDEVEGCGELRFLSVCCSALECLARRSLYLRRRRRVFDFCLHSHTAEVTPSTTPSPNRNTR